MLRFQWCCLLLVTHFLSDCQPLNCTKKQYEWPEKNPTLCCKKCDPGHFMRMKCVGAGVGTVCLQCGQGSYMDDYNYELKCKRCSDCTKPNMEPKKPCNSTSNTVCGCKSGFICNNDQCAQCVKPPPTTTTTKTLMTTTIPTRRPPTSFDSVWISLSLCCACVCFLLTCFILISRHTPACGWAVSASTDYCFWHPKKSSANSSQCTEDEEVPMPVQEVSGGKECPEGV